MSSTVIVGAGIIGVSTAYYLSEHQDGSTIHLIEAAPQLFASSSGFAGGFLARDWFSSASAPLGALSFDEHRRLAEKEGGRAKWAYASSQSFSHAASAEISKHKRGEDWLRHGDSRGTLASSSDPESSHWDPPWLNRVDGDYLQFIGRDGTTAQL
jgi:glycine/D-amino acid oxidase-like deaminating enzyme